MHLLTLACVAPLQLLALALLLSLATAKPSGLRFELTHVDSKGGFTKTELFRRAAHRSSLRARMFPGRHASSSSTPGIAPRVHFSMAEYLIELAIGTPPVPFIAIADTGSDLIWTQCQPCIRCFPQSTPKYNPHFSFSFSLLPCSSTLCQGTPSYSINHTCSPPLCKYFYSYADNAYSQGVLGVETLTFRSGGGSKFFVPVNGITFGCGNVNEGESFNSTGTVGLGRGPWSLVSQLGYGKFSYCLTSFMDTRGTSPLLFGSFAELNSVGGAVVQTTPLIHNPYSPTFYYVSLQGISIGKTRLRIPKGVFELQSDGSGGTIVDSGTAFTRLEMRAYKEVVKYIKAIIGLPAANGSIDCYQAPKGASPSMPDMTLHFAGGADMKLHSESYMMFDEDTGEYCLGMIGVDGQSTVGNFQQQNIHVLYDIVTGQLSFVPADCSKL